MASVDTGNTSNVTVNDPNNPLNQNGLNPNVNGIGQNNNNQPATTGGAGAVTSTGASNVTGQVVGTNAPPQPFQNIASYIAANGPQSQQLAGNVANTVTQPINQAQTGITNLQDTFGNAITAGSTPVNQDLINAVSNNPAGVVAENPQNVTNFLGQLNDTYTGPSDITQAAGYNDLETQIANAQAQAANTQNTAGIQTLLQGVEGPTTGGINTLDTALLSTPENLATVQASGVPAAALPGTLNDVTAAENAAASNAATQAPLTAQAAQQALATAQANEVANLTNEQNTIQGVVNEYNQSVNTINPTTADIASVIQNFLQANPNITLNDATNALAPLMNLSTIAMPTEATYASPEDYATIAALTQLGLTPDQLASLPISSATANEAQTFNVPTLLQNALGQAPTVENALQTELNTIGNQINTPAQNFQNAETEAYDSNVLIPAQQSAQQAVTIDQTNIANLQSNDQTDSNVQALLNVAQTQLATDQATLDSANAAINTAQQQTGVNAANWNNWNVIAPMAQQLGWVNPAITDYQTLVNQINADLGKLGNVGALSLTYAPDTVTDPVTGVPIGTVAANQLGKSAISAAPAAAGAGIASGIAAGADVAGAGAAEAMGEGLGASEAGVGTAAEETAPIVSSELAPAGQIGTAVGTGTTTALSALPPVAVAAYGAQNIEQNIVANPVKSLAMIAGNTLSLGALSLPPQVWKNIEGDISSIVNDIGNFFGNLF